MLNVFVQTLAHIWSPRCLLAMQW